MPWAGPAAPRQVGQVARDLLLPALEASELVVVPERRTNAGSGSFGLVTGRRLVGAGLRQSRVKVLDSALQSLDEARRVDGAPLVGRPPDLRPGQGNRQSDLVEAPVDAGVKIEAGEVPDRDALGSTRRLLHEGRDQPVEVIGSVHPLAVGGTVHGHREAVASGVLPPLDGGFKLADTPAG
jgi:hypothetical protein